MKVYQDCEVINIPQRSPEWLELRKGNITASNCGEWLIEGKKIRITIEETKAVLDENGIPYKKSSNRDSLICLLPPEYLVATYSKEAETAKEAALCSLLEGLIDDPTCPPPPRPNGWMQRGTDLEPIAASAFALATGFDLDFPGFCQSLHGHFGCSPDGLIPAINSGLEIKVLAPCSHLRYLRAGVLPKEFRMQVLHSMAVTGADSWYFFAYQPTLPPLSIKVDRCENVERLKTNLIAFSDEIDIAKASLARQWAEWQAV